MVAKQHVNKVILFLFAQLFLILEARASPVQYRFEGAVAERRADQGGSENLYPLSFDAAISGNFLYDSTAPVTDLSIYHTGWFSAFDAISEFSGVVDGHQFSSQAGTLSSDFFGYGLSFGRDETFTSGVSQGFAGFNSKNYILRGFHIWLESGGDGISLPTDLSQTANVTFYFTDPLGNDYSMAMDGRVQISLVPLPASGFLLGSAMLGVAGAVRKRRAEK